MSGSTLAFIATRGFQSVKKQNAGNVSDRFYRFVCPCLSEFLVWRRLRGECPMHRCTCWVLSAQVERCLSIHYIFHANRKSSRTSWRNSSVHGRMMTWKCPTRSLQNPRRRNLMNPLILNSSRNSVRALIVYIIEHLFFLKHSFFHQEEIYAYKFSDKYTGSHV